VLTIIWTEKHLD